MNLVSGPVPLGEWLPDMPNLQFPNLLEATNVEPAGTVYKNFGVIAGTGTAIPGGYIRGAGQAILNGSVYHYAHTDTGIYENQGTAAFTSRSSTITYLAAQADFLQFDDWEIVALGTSNPVLYHTVGSSSDFDTLGSASGEAPASQRVGRINKFVVVGDTVTGPNHIRWSGLDDPLSWPAANSATATAQQAGEQYMDIALGRVTGFASGDQFGIVFQECGITRVSYIGPPSVFQFDKISDKVGCTRPRSIVQVGGFTYFVGTDGIYKTDGVSLLNVGFNKVGKYFLTSSVGAKERVYGAVNVFKKLIYWIYCADSDGESLPSKFLIYNYEENRFTEANEHLEYIFSTSGLESYAFLFQNQVIQSSNTLGAISDSSQPTNAAVVQVGYAEINPGGYAQVQGVKFIADLTANARGCILEYGTDVEFTGSSTVTSLVTANSATGFSDFRVEARYHAPKFSSLGLFSQLSAIEFLAKPSGMR